jgi:hypothetical protein
VPVIRDVYVKPSRAAYGRLMAAVVETEARVLDVRKLFWEGPSPLLAMRVDVSELLLWKFSARARPWRIEEPPVARV